MGCSQSTSHAQNNNGPAFSADIKDGLFLLGSLTKGPMVIRYSPGNIESIRAPVKFPKYAHAFINEDYVGFITGGVEQLQSTSAELKSLQQQQYEGVISKRFIKVDLKRLPFSPNNSFEELPDMINARYAHCAIEHNYSVYVIGGREYGDDDIGILSACEKFDFGTKKWKTIPSLQYPRAGASTVIFGHLIYVFGGYTGKNQRSRVIESFEEGDAGWRKIPFRLHEGIQGALIMPNPMTQTSVYIFGGKTDDGKINDVVELNFSKSTVQRCDKLVEKRCFHKGYFFDKVAHIIGGGTDTIQFYGIEKQQSSLEKQLSFLQHCSTKELAALSALMPQVKLKGNKRSYESPNFANKAFIFGHAKEAFTKIIDLDRMVIISEGQNLFHNFYLFPTVVQVNKETNFIMGGINPDFTEVTDLVYSFNVRTEEIKYLQPLKMAKYGFSAAVKGSYLYIAGGRKLGGDQIAILSACERYSFETYEWESIAPLKHKRHSAMLLPVGNFLMIVGGYRGNGVRSNDIQLYIEADNRWAEVEQKFQLAAEAMTPVVYKEEIFIFGGRAEQIDIQKVFKLNITIDEGIKYEKALKSNLEPVGNLSASGTNLKVCLNKEKGLAYVFGNIKNGIDVYDLKKNKIVQKEVLSVFMNMQDPLFQAYAVVF